MRLTKDPLTASAARRATQETRRKEASELTNYATVSHQKAMKVFPKWYAKSHACIKASVKRGVFQTTVLINPWFMEAGRRESPQWFLIQELVSSFKSLGYHITYKAIDKITIVW